MVARHGGAGGFALEVQSNPRYVVLLEDGTYVLYARTHPDVDELRLVEALVCAAGKSGWMVRMKTRLADGLAPIIELVQPLNRPHVAFDAAVALFMMKSQ